MKVILEDGTKLKIRELSFDQWREFMAELLSSNPNSSSIWDLMSCVRGPDTPSEKESMDSDERSEAYRGRRQRKYETVEVIRNAMFFGTVGGAARHHKADHVTLPPSREHDHFDRHVARAAHLVGLSIKTKE